MERKTRTSGIRAVLFDFGGVVADEGFVEAMNLLAAKRGADPLALINAAFEASYEIGFSSGKVREESYWPLFASRTGIDENTGRIKEEILSRYRLRPWMFGIVSRLKERGALVCLLSDQSHWLDELNERMDFFRHFDHVFNSYNLGITKKDPAIFDLVLERIELRPDQALFVDDHLPHVRRARGKGLRAIHFTKRDALLRDLAAFFPFLDEREQA